MKIGQKWQKYEFLAEIVRVRLLRSLEPRPKFGCSMGPKVVKDREGKEKRTEGAKVGREKARLGLGLGCGSMARSRLLMFRSLRGFGL